MRTVHQISEASGWLWAIIADHLWQSAIVVAIAALICAIARHAPARIRYRIWLVAAAKVALPSVALAIVIVAVRVAAGYPAAPSPGSAAHLPAGDAISQLTDPFQVPGDGPSRSSASRDWIYACLSLVWLTGFVLTLGNWLWRRRRLLHLIGAAAPAAGPALIGVLAKARAAAGVNRDVTLVVSDVVAEPGVWGVWRPIILLPARAVGELHEDELEAGSNCRHSKTLVKE